MMCVLVRVGVWEVYVVDVWGVCVGNECGE